MDIFAVSARINKLNQDIEQLNHFISVGATDGVIIMAVPGRNSLEVEFTPDVKYALSQLIQVKTAERQKLRAVMDAANELAKGLE